MFFTAISARKRAAAMPLGFTPEIAVKNMEF